MYYVGFNNYIRMEQTAGYILGVTIAIKKDESDTGTSKGNENKKDIVSRKLYSSTGQEWLIKWLV